MDRCTFKLRYSASVGLPQFVAVNRNAAGFEKKVFAEILGRILTVGKHLISVDQK